MAHRIQLGSALRFIVCAAILASAWAQPLVAQESPRIIVGGGGINVLSATHVTAVISDSAIRALIETHLPDALQNDADAHHVLLVVDSNGEYVSGKVNKMTVVTPQVIDANGTRIFVGGDTTGGGAGARVMFRGADGGVATSLPAAAGSVIIARSQNSDGDSLGGVLGSTYPMSEISSIGMRRFVAGELGRGAIMVSVIRLK